MTIEQRNAIKEALNEAKLTIVDQDSTVIGPSGETTNRIPERGKRQRLAKVIKATKKNAADNRRR